MKNQLTRENTARCFFYMLFSHIFSLLFILIYLPSAAQHNTPAVNIKTLTVEDGLSQSTVYSIAQDSKGFMWFATFNGLDRYDGNGFVHFRHDDSNPFSISSNQVYSLLTDKKGRLWAGTWDNGLNYFDAAQRQWHHFLPGKNIFDLQEDGDSGLYVCDNETLTHLSLFPVPALKKGKLPFRMNITTVKLPLPMAMPSVGNARLFVSRQKQVYLTTRTELYSVHLEGKTGAMRFTRLFTFSRGWTIPVFLEDRNTGTYYLSTADGLWASGDSRFTNPAKIHTAVFYYGTAYIDNKSRFWYNSAERVDTLNLLTGKEALFTRLSNPTENVFAQFIPLMQDRNGTIWMRTPINGIVTYADDENHFHTLLPGFYINNIDCIGSNTCLVNNQFVLRAEADSISTKEREKKEFDFFHNVLHTRGNNAEGWYIKDTMLMHYNPATGIHHAIAIPYHLLGVPLQHALGSGSAINNITYSIPVLTSIIDRDRCLWLTCPKGFAFYNIERDSFCFVGKGVNARNMYQDESGVVWMNAADGVYAYSKVTGTTRFFTRSATSKKDALPVAPTDLIFCDDPIHATHILWIGSDNGLYRMNKETGICSCFDSKTGMPDNLICGLLRDEKRGNLWISTNQGLSCLNAATFSIRNFSEADGLQGREFNQGSALQLQDGTMLFGGSQGLTYFRPDDIVTVPPPLTVITGCQLFGKPIDKDATGALLTDLAYMNNISISYQENIVSFSFAGIDYRKKSALQYRYKLVPFDKDWQYPNDAHEATYTNLDPGNYTFVAEASNTNNVWGKESEPLQVHILPLWWQTWWCKGLAAIAVLAVFYGVYRYRLRKALEVERVRNRIASDLHDEIGSTLSAINLFSQIAHEQSKTATVSPQLLERINQTSQKVTQTMSDIVWSVSAKNDSFEKIITHMHEHAIQLMELKGYELSFIVDEKIGGISLSMEKRQNIYLIYKEALNNVVKYANGKHVWVSIRKEKTKLLLSVKDDGAGFDTGKRNGGNGLQNMKHRATVISGDVRITSAAGCGSEVLVSVPV